MTEKYDDESPALTEQPVAEERRAFLRSLGKWSQVVIGGVLLGTAASRSDAASGWFNRGGDDWHDPGGRGRGDWFNRPPRHRDWFNRPPRDWSNRRGWQNGPRGGWDDRGDWFNRRGGGWFNR